ncbi:hypothetical protein [Chitinophaga costaii]|uniref:hypothetical protein n=1 Tax=Chitinophaga costaii TaxID=1335309 RepID=UPI001F0CDADC|nr:hypothetical protein [Chitinophaga costaii]
MINSAKPFSNARFNWFAFYIATLEIGRITQYKKVKAESDYQTDGHSQRRKKIG